MPEAIKGNIVFEFANAVYIFGIAISSSLLGQKLICFKWKVIFSISEKKWPNVL